MIEETESEVRKHIKKTVSNDNFQYEAIKKECAKMESSLFLLQKKNKLKSCNLFEVYNSLRGASIRLEELKEETKEIKECIDSICQMNVCLQAKEEEVLKCFKLSKNSLMMTGINQTLLLKTLSESMGNSLKDILKDSENDESDKTESEKLPSIVGLADKLKEEADKDSAYENDIIYRSHIDHQLKPNVKELTNIKMLKRSAILDRNRGGSVKRRISLSNHSRVDTINFHRNSFNKPAYHKDSFDVNVYRDSNTSQITQDRFSKTINLRKMSVRDTSPNSSNYEFSEKNSKLSLKGCNIKAVSFHKVLYDAFNKRKIIEKVIFRDNTFSCDIFEVMKDFFKKPMKKQVLLDFRRNKLKLNYKMMQFSKKTLSLLNVKVIV